MTDQDNNKKTVSKQGVEGDTAIYYSIDENNTVIRLHNITKPGKYTLQLTADYYAELNTTFTMAGSLKKVPNTTPNISFANGIYSLDFGNVLQDWWYYVDAVTVNGKAYTANSRLYLLSMLGDTEYGWYDPSYNGYNILNLGASAFTEDKNTVVIRNTKYGYEDLTLTITKDGKLVVDGSDNSGSGDNGGSETPAETQDAPKPTSASTDIMGDYKLSFDDTSYISKITAVKVNGTTYSSGVVWNNNTYSISMANDGYLSIGSGSFVDGNNTVTITATGYKELTVTITKDGNLVDNDNSNSGNNSGSNTGGNGNAGETTQKDYPSNMGFNYGGTLYFDQGGSNAAAEPYLNSITRITLNGKTLSPMDSSSWWIKTGEYNVKSSSTDKYIEFYSQDFSESENILVIYADGYKDMTLKVNKGGSKIIE